jgi:multimeric flavodoxin WrbA
MHIVVFNGSPKGDVSVTMQYVQHLAKRFPQHTMEIVHIAQRIRKIESNEAYFQSILDTVKQADGVLWAFPLYTMLVHSHYKRFIELIFERGVGDAFAGAYTAALSTSIHFFDHTAHNYIRAICDDLGMKYVDGFSADMNGLLDAKKRSHFIQFAERFFGAIEKAAPTQPAFAPLMARNVRYEPGTPTRWQGLQGKRVLVVTDAGPADANLRAMVERFTASFDGEVSVIDLHDVDIKGGCLGCLRCGHDNVCAYTGKDGFVDFWNSQMRQADILVWAGAMHDRYLSSLWKTVLDRRFFNTHTPTLIGKQLAFIISGPLAQTPNLREILDAYAQMEMASLAGIVTDEYGDSTHIDSLLQNLAEDLVARAAGGYATPSNFLGVGGQKLFRDEVWSRLRVVFRADHRAYRRLGMYDFPQKKLGQRLVTGALGMLLRLPPMRKGMQRHMKQGMIMPLRKAVESQD